MGDEGYKGNRGNIFSNRCNLSNKGHIITGVTEETHIIEVTETT